jgi:hypothetical protein
MYYPKTKEVHKKVFVSDVKSGVKQRKRRTQTQEKNPKPNVIPQHDDARP